MPELPDVTIYIEALQERVLDQPIQKIRIGSPFVVALLRSADRRRRRKESFRRFAGWVNASFLSWKTNSFSSFIS